MPFHSFHMGLLLTYSTGLYVPPSCKKNLRTFKSLTYLSFYQNADMLQATLKNMSQYGGFMFWSYHFQLIYTIHSKTAILVCQRRALQRTTTGRRR